MFAGCFLVLGSGAAALWWGQERIIGLFVQQANQYLRTPVRVGKIELSLFDQFPRVAITMHRVVVTGSLPHDTTALARAQRLYFAFDAWDLLARRYRVRAVTLTDGQVAVRLDAQGRPNYDVLQMDTAASATDEPFAFDLEGIQLGRIGVTYVDASRQQQFAGHTRQMRATLSVKGEEVTVRAEGETHVQALRVVEDAYFQEKDLMLTTHLRINRQTQQIAVLPSEIRIGQATYGVAGTIGYYPATKLNLRLEGRQTDVQSLLALLPPRLNHRLAGYRSRGEVYFRGTVRGEFSTKVNPRLDFQFGCRDAAFYHPQYQQEAEHVFLTGAFTNGSAHSVRTAVLDLRNVRGQLGGRPFSGSLRYSDFQEPSVQLQLLADLDMARATRFFPVAAVRGATGTAQLSLQVAGPVAQLRAGRATNARGELTLHDVAVQLRAYSQPLRRLNGRLELRGNNVTMQSLTGYLGRSDFRVNGTLKNTVSWLLTPRQTLLIQAQVNSGLWDFDELLRLPTAVSTSKRGGRAGGEYALELPATLALDVQTNVRHLRFRRLRGRELHGTVRLRNQIVSSPALSVRAAGGRASIRGTVDVRRPNLVKVSTTATCTQVPLDSLFYVFEDFGQHFITARHLRGQLTAQIDSDVYLDGALYPLTDRLEAEVKATVRNGELNNFAPLQKLSMVANREQLRHLRFAELKNSLYVQSRTVYIPEMDIRSNVRTASLIQVTGTHTFDQQMDYHLSIPLLPGLLRRPDAAGGTPTGPRLLLAVRGNEQDFTVRYDRARAQLVTGARPEAASPAAAPRPTTTRPGILGRILQPTTRPSTGEADTRPATVPRKSTPKPAAQPQPGEYFEF
ncbi:hypothetical protein F1C16_17600 [Hymenobacter sp. NBH84]|uniref:AsmA-like C-terminal region-containing protein n=1 Tax=Hymenobacter sp. NBH84 TaxID=2596915 RepID=UPI0016290DE6|nr:AsmA-like C-terminal region-containing protein [Hymenobacter sp. NBH84]QNE41238.1 hypothetical protein F1C16_17600 [Hymenobacter sp. NBH84]